MPVLLLLAACASPSPGPSPVAPDPVALAADSLGHAFEARNGAWTTTRPGLHATLDTTGARLRGRGAEVRFGSAASWRRDGARLASTDGRVTTWWQSTPQGLELGFDVQGPGPVLLPVEGGPVRTTPTGDLAVLDLRLTGLVAHDAHGDVVPVTMRPSDGGIRFDVSADAWPVEIDPVVTTSWAVPIPADGLVLADLNADGYGDLAVGDAWADVTAPDSREGRLSVFYGTADGLADEADWVWGGDVTDSRLAYALSSADYDGDGVADLAVGLPGALSSTGAVRVFRGSTSGVGTDYDDIEGVVGHGSFGYDLASGDFDQDGYADLFVAQLAPRGVQIFRGSVDGVEASASYELEIDDDGIPTVAVGDLDGDGWLDLVVGAEGYEDGEPYEGGVSFYYGRSSGFLSSPDLLWEPDKQYSHCGATVAVGDWNADGYDDVAAGCPYFDTWESYAGRIVLFYGAPGGTAAEPDWERTGDPTDRELGQLLASAGDLDADGDPELLYAGTGDDYTGPGEVDLHAGSTAGVADDPDWRFVGAGPAFVATRAAGGEDVDGDGYDDLALGSGILGETGRTWLTFGSADGPLGDAPDWREDAVGLFGTSVAWSGDVDGDGYAELLVGEEEDEDGVSHVYTFRGSPDGLQTPSWQDLDDTTGAGFGKSVVSAGDVDGDGLPDLLSGAPLASDTFTEEGRVDLYLGDGDGFGILPAWTLYGGEDGGVLGQALRGLGDVNGDGYDDVAIAQPFWSGTETDCGRLRIYIGDPSSGLSTTAVVELDGDQAGAELGTTVDVAGDVDGDGRADLLVGTPGYSYTETDEGRVDLWYGDGGGIDPTPGWTVFGGEPGAYAGRVAGGADLDDDGVVDVAVGAPGVDEVRVYSGFATTPEWRVTSSSTGIDFGGTLAMTGDLDGDGDSELFIGAPSFVDAEGAGWVYTGQSGGPSDVPALSWRGGWPEACFSCTVAGGADADGDGLADLAIGSPGLGLVEVWYGGPLDGDGDGVLSDSDCDDTDATVSPDTTEVADGKDNDCDGVIDDPDTWYADDDDDGWGDPADSIATFTPPSGFVADGTDCDDDRPEVHPDAPELCDGLDDDCDGEVDEDAVDAVDWYSDDDGDGYAGTLADHACAGPDGSSATVDDCDDTDATVSPAATELCDGIDNDCSGALDDDAPADALVYYEDLDGDDYGADTTASAACEAPEGWVLVGGDCDDGDRQVNPDETESCDGVDEDCDGTVDDGATDATTGYPDLDGDLYGDASGILITCTLPVGYVLQADDCDDTDASVSPVGKETCDGVDQDCDGTVDEGANDGETYHSDHDLDGFGGPDKVYGCGAPAGSVDNDEDCDDYDATIGARVVWFGDADHDGHGDVTVRTLGCSAPTGYTSTSDDCDDSRVDVYPDAPEVCDGVDDDCDGEVDEDAVDAGTWYDDADGDGLGDPETGMVGCEGTDGQVDAGNDCDDTDPDSGAPQPMFQDFDGDGYGNPFAVTDQCVGTAGWSIEGTDCDDTDAAISPAGVEVCDGRDDDCDGEIDEDAADALTWYTDADLDGWGDPESGTTGCDPPDGVVEDHSDCDDADASIHPAATEIWYDGVDQDCDGVDDDQDGDGVPYGEDCDDTNAARTVGCRSAGDTATKTGAASSPEGCGCTTASDPRLGLGLVGLTALLRRRVRRA